MALRGQIDLVMAKAILALNAGSSSIKFAVYRAGDDLEGSLICNGILDKRATDARFTVKDPTGEIIDDASHSPAKSADLTSADLVLALLDRLQPVLGNCELSAVGHRIVHGGPGFLDPIVIDDHVLKELEELTPLAPLHQPGCLAPVRSLLRARPGLLQVACFDTAFHRHLEPIYRRFPIPDFGEDVRRYGFHGLSFEYIARRLNEPRLRTVIAHLGSGSSLCALHNGRSVNTTMSLTPLDGLMMATRGGAMDPGVVFYLQRSKGLSVDEVENTLYNKSGLLGVSGHSADMRTLLSSSAPQAKQAIEQFCARCAELVAVMATNLGGFDLLVFTGGVGENSAVIRSNICERLRWLGIGLDGGANHQGSDTISAATSRITVRVIPTNEEAMIAHHTADLIKTG
jgi:acetate kinase